MRVDASVDSKFGTKTEEKRRKLYEHSPMKELLEHPVLVESWPGPIKASQTIQTMFLMIHHLQRASISTETESIG